MHEPPISTERLLLHHIPADGLIALLDEKSDQLAISHRDFANPLRVLVKDEGPLPWRVPQVKEDPTKNRWFIRFIVLKEINQVIGSISFHGIPDEAGMIEIGLGIEEPFRGNGYAQEALMGMWRWACGEEGVKVLRYTVSPDNAPSMAIINRFGFTYKGVQIDEEDGPENIYEMSVDEFRDKWGSEDER